MRDTKNQSLSIQYVNNLFVDTQEDLQHAYSNAESVNKTGMALSSTEGKLLQVLTQLSGSKKVIEVGTFTGYSALYIARGLPDDGHLWTLEFNKTHIDLAQDTFKNSSLKQKITLVPGDALVSLQKLSTNGPFDMIFIDADKGGYMQYLQWAESNIRKGGLIIGDNTYLFGSAYAETPPKGISKKSWQTMREFNKTLANPKKYTSILVDTSEGLTVAIKNF